MQCRVKQDGRVTVESSDKTWSTGEGNGKPLHYACFENAISSVQSLSRVLCDPMDGNTPGFPVHTKSQSLLKFMSIVLVMPSNHLILCHPLRLLPSIFPRIRVFLNKSAFRIRWPKCWSFSFSVSPSNECSGLISFRIHWLDLLAVQGTLKSLLQHHSSKTSILWHLVYAYI